MRLAPRCLALLLVVAPALSACSDIQAPVAASPEQGPLLSISDAVHEAGNEHFFWLPPMVGNPESYNGTFDESQAPIVSICDLSACGTAIATFSTTTGSGSEIVRVEADDELYVVNWHTDEFDVGPGATYRISVTLQDVVLGYADVQLGATGKDVKNIDTDALIALKDGRTLPIKFRIEEGAVPVELVWVRMQGTPPPTNSGFGMIWGIDANDVYVVGPGLGNVSHFDGTSWATLSFGANVGQGGVWALSSTEVFVVGGDFISQNVLSRGNSVDGFALVPGYPPGAGQQAFTAGVWGASANDLHTVGRGGRALWYDGNAWQSLPTPNTSNFEDVKGADSNNVFAVGTNATVMRYDGATWSNMPVPQGINVQFNTVWAAAPKDVFVGGSDGVIIHYDGSQWTQMVTGTTSHITGIHGVSPTDVMASGSNGTILYYDGVSWESMDSGVTDFLISVWGASATEWYASSPDGFMLRTVVQ